MSNPMMTNLTASRISPVISQIKNMPQSMLCQIPQYKQVMDYVQMNGGDPQAAFYKRAQEMGIDPGAILQQLRQ